MSLGRMEAKFPKMKETLFSIQQTSNEPALNETVRAQIGRRLRSVFDGVADPLPDRFHDLLMQLEAKLHHRAIK